MLVGSFVSTLSTGKTTGGLRDGGQIVRFATLEEENNFMDHRYRHWNGKRPTANLLYRTIE